MLPSTSPREACLTCPPFPLLALVHLDFPSPHDVVLWNDGCIPFPFGKGAYGVFANCSLCGIETILSFSAGPACSSFSAEACAILQALCWSRQNPQVCHLSSLLLLSNYRSVLTSPPSYLSSLFSPPSFFLPQSLWQILQELSSLSPVLLGYNWSPDTRFSQGTTRLMSWPDRERYFRPQQSLLVVVL